jgi:2-polyprenyl-3-methyl-5-hydroxy-6-metoxy-1,4-benzoquinol methylase
MGERSSDDTRDLNRESREIWDRNAVFWDEKMGEGNQLQKLLVGPATERLLDLHPGQLVLDLACGNGVMARTMARLGVQVLACDFAPTFLERARARSVENGDLIEYREIDATDVHQLLELGERRFDAAVCNMALMDMVTIDPLLLALARLLKPKCHFVFSVMHPCFNSAATRMTVEHEDRDGELTTTYAVNISAYNALGTRRGVGIVGQPAPHYYFHRTLTTLFNACFKVGFVLDGIEEPTFEPGVEPSRPFSWANFREIPPVLAARMRLIQSKQ